MRPESDVRPDDGLLPVGRKGSPLREPDLAKKLKDLAHRRGQSFKQTLNEVVRKGLSAQAPRREGKRYAVKAHRGGFRPGIDPGKLNRR
ncbi:MAG: hypothetical protein AMXMBFR34_21650 [Myxococcaceae bacterium]